MLLSESESEVTQLFAESLSICTGSQDHKVCNFPSTRRRSDAILPVTEVIRLVVRIARIIIFLPSCAESDSKGDEPMGTV